MINRIFVNKVKRLKRIKNDHHPLGELQKRLVLQWRKKLWYASLNIRDSCQLSYTHIPIIPCIGEVHRAIESYLSVWAVLACQVFSEPWQCNMFYKQHGQGLFHSQREQAGQSVKRSRTGEQPRDDAAHLIHLLAAGRLRRTSEPQCQETLK